MINFLQKNVESVTIKLTFLQHFLKAFEDPGKMSD